MKKIIFTIHHNLVFIGTAFSISVLLCFIPLTNVIGYEFSALMSVVVSFLSGLKIIRLRKKITSLYSFPEMLKEEVIFFIILFTIPLIVSFLNTLLFQICPELPGIMFYIVFVLPSMLVGLALGAVIINSVNRFHLFLYIFIYLIILFLPLVEIYFRPQIYLYHSIFTYFPGTIYDDLIEIDSKLLLFRFISMLPFGIIFIYTLFIKNHNERILILPFIGFIILYASYFGLKPEIGFSTTQKTLEKNLSNKLVTDNFIINYPNSLTDKQVNNLLFHHEYYFQKLQEDTKIKYDNKIISFVFKDREQKRKLFGAGNADVAKPWLNQIYTQYESYNTSLKHELSHVFASEIGSNLFKVAQNFNPSMIEGYAMAVENNYSDYDIHYLAKIAKYAGYVYQIPDLFEGFNFLSGTSSISYIYAGSFIKYLIEEFGIEKVNSLYSNMNFELYFGKNLSDLADDYNIFLTSLDYAPDSSKAQLFFGRQSLFKRNCPRVTAQNLKNAWEHYRNSDFMIAGEIFKETYFFSANYSALSGSILSLIKLKKFQEASDILQNELKHFEKSSFYFNLLFRQADVFGYLKNYEKSDSVYQKLLKISPSDLFTTIVQLRLYLLNYSEEIYQTYLNAENPERFYLLSEIINQNNYEVILPHLIDLASRNKISVNLVEKIITRVGISNVLSDYNFYNSLSNYYLESNKWEKASYFAQQANVVVSKSRAAVSSENLDKNEWIANFADSIRFTIRYE